MLHIKEKIILYVGEKNYVNLDFSWSFKFSRFNMINN